MRGNSRINRQQQVKVVIRLKPDTNQAKFSKCVYLSEKQENQLVVETDEKKEIFAFDHIAHQNTSQQQLYHMLGKQCVTQTFDGYNCCIFAYGQTGAGKTYSVLGNTSDLLTDPYSPSRGLLPRILQDLFQQTNSVLTEKGKQSNTQKCSVICSYLQIYNEQILDLLSNDKRIHQIRQDAKKGVFVQGLIEKKVASYKHALQILLQGQKTRKMASTLMNVQSSRSHAIFSIRVESQVIEEEVIRSKKAKLHIVDLAGSERVKHTNVQGQRLRQGCNINRSLHVLGNVINSLVESTKKKKHIPYRDSKLTHYLKDSLGGNSITKLLANVHTNKYYFGDTLSTLMFAKRAKILKTKVQLNETSADNFDALRKQVRRLRQQLAHARYFQTEGRTSERGSFDGQMQWSYEKGHSSDQTQNESPQRMDTLKKLQQNQLHFKALIEIYQEQMKDCLTSSNLQRKHNINIVKQWKNLQKRNISLTHLVKQIPSFTKIYKENLLLKQQRNRVLQGLNSDEEIIKSKAETNGKLKQIQTNQEQQYRQIAQFYQQLLKEVQTKFKSCIQILQKNYLELEVECKLKDKKIKQLRKKKQYPPDIEELKNKNEYLNLSILQLQNQIAKLNERQQKLTIEVKESRKNTAKKGQRSDVKDSQTDDGDQICAVYDRLLQIKNEAEKEAQMHEKQRAQMQQTIQNLQNELNKFLRQNSTLRTKYRKSQSRNHRSRQRQQFNRRQSHIPTTKTANMLSDSRSREFQHNQTYMKGSQLYYKSAKNISELHDSPSVSIQQTTIKELLTLKIEVKRKQKEINDLKSDVQQFMSCDRKIQQQFGKTLQQIIQEYRKTIASRTLTQSKSQKILNKWKDPDPASIFSKYQVKQEGNAIFTSRASSSKKEESNQSKQGAYK